MTDFTIEQLEALKEGITPGPWEVNRSEIGVREIMDGEVDLRYLTTWEGEFDNDNDAELAAAAPSLVDALIAEKQENQRMRTELEALRGECLDSANAAENNARNADNWEALEAVAYTDRDTADAIARILEDDNE